MVECVGHKGRGVVRKEVVPGGGEDHHCSCNSGEKALEVKEVINATGSRGGKACDIWDFGVGSGGQEIYERLIDSE